VGLIFDGIEEILFSVLNEDIKNYIMIDFCEHATGQWDYDPVLIFEFEELPSSED